MPSTRTRRICQVSDCTTQRWRGPYCKTHYRQTERGEAHHPAQPRRPWHESLLLYYRWAIEHGRSPHRHSDDDTEKSLAIWWHNTLNHRRRGRLNSAQLAELDQMLPATLMNTLDQARRAHVRQERLARLAGRVCSVDGCTRGVQCRGFCAGHYAQVRQGRELRPLNPTWEESLTEVAQWVREHARTPSSTADDGVERRLAEWLTRNRRMRRRGELRAEQVEAFAVWSEPELDALNGQRRATSVGEPGEAVDLVEVERAFGPLGSAVTRSALGLGEILVINDRTRTHVEVAGLLGRSPGAVRSARRRLKSPDAPAHARYRALLREAEQQLQHARDTHTTHNQHETST